jgi:hypothetical protein
MKKQPKPKLKVKTQVKGGLLSMNHNERML